MGTIHHQLLQELAAVDQQSSRDLFRMDFANFQSQRQNAKEAIPPGQRLTVTLRFLAYDELKIFMFYDEYIVTVEHDNSDTIPTAGPYQNPLFSSM